MVQEYFYVDLILLCVHRKEDFVNGDVYIGDDKQSTFEDIVELLHEGK